MSKGFGHLTIRSNWKVRDNGVVDGGDHYDAREADWGDWE